MLPLGRLLFVGLAPLRDPGTYPPEEEVY